MALVGQFIYGFFLEPRPFDSVLELTTSHVALLTPGVLAFLRFSVLWFSMYFELYVFPILGETRNFLASFTILAVEFFPTYCFLASAYSVLVRQGRLAHKSISARQKETLEERVYGIKATRLFQACCILLATAVQTYPPYVAIAFWTFLADPSSSNLPSAYTKTHFLCTIFSIFEITLTNIPAFPWNHLLFCVLFLVLWLKLGLYMCSPGTMNMTYRDIIIQCLLYTAVFVAVRCMVLVRMFFVKKAERRDRRARSAKLGGTGQGRRSGSGATVDCGI